jgi:hypothetical protein
VADLAIQASFNTGEWSPSLYARVDLAKYRSGAALLENFFVDYRGGASSRPGTKYILRCYKSNTSVRLISFQASSTVGYLLELGDFYVRFYNNGTPVLETTIALTGATNANPAMFTKNAHGLSNGDWVFASNFAGGTWATLNGKYYIVANVTTNTFTLTDLFGNAISGVSLGTWSAGSVARVYTIVSPYAAADLASIKFAQNVDIMVLCHPDYKPYVLTLIVANNWTLNPIVFGTTATTPTGLSASSTLGGGSANYSYVVTSVDIDGQESTPSVPVAILGRQDLRSVAGSNSVTWAIASGAQSYNVYKSDVSYFGVVPSGATYGFIGNTAGSTFVDSNIAADFSQTPPIAQNPFQGSSVASITVINPGNYSAVPTVTIGSAPAGGSTATASATLNLIGYSPISNANPNSYNVNDIVNFPNSVSLVVAAVDANQNPTVYQALNFPGSNPGLITSGSAPATMTSTGGGSGSGARINCTWGVNAVNIISAGAGYLTPPTVSFSSGSATAQANLGASTGFTNPSVPAFFQQRLVLAAPTSSPQTFYMSRTGESFNFNISNPVEADDAITASLQAGQLNTIKSFISQTSGLLAFTDRAAWLINGGQGGVAVSPSSIIANAQSYNGANDVPPIVANYDVLYVQSKGSVIRDNAYNIYANVFTGTDISIIASHLFYGYQVLEWAWAEEPFKVVWAIRDDGVMLTLTFLKEQEFVGWAHSITQGSFRSVAAVTEASAVGVSDVIYTVVERTVNGSQVKYIEKVTERIFPNGVVDAWCVDSGLQYSGTPATTFSGGEHLAGLTVTGLADGVVIPPFTMPASGSFTLPQPASKVTVGLGYTCKLQTLAIDMGEPTIQGRVKKISNVDVRVSQTLGLYIGQDFDHLVPMKDLIRGNVSSMLTGQQNQVVTDLVTGDARTFLSPTFTVPGQYCIQLTDPYPASILGVIPNITVGDSK